MTTYWNGYANKFPTQRSAPKAEDRRRISEKLSKASSGFWITERSGRTCPLNLEPRARFTAGFVSGLRPESLRYLWEKRVPWLSKVYECFVDGTFAKAKGGGDGIGCTRAGKGVKIMIMVDAKGLPVAAYSTTASAHESHLVQRLFDFMVPGQVPERLIGDKAYDDDNLDDQMAEMGVEMIAPNRSNRSQTQDGRPLRRYKKRWTVERTIAWLQHFRRLCIRWEKSTVLFQGLLHLACCILLMKEVLG